MRRAETIVFIAALIGVPLISAVIIVEAASGSGGALLRVALPAAIGVVVGVLMVALSAFGRLPGQTRNAATVRRRELGPVATALIIGGALVGGFSTHLPVELTALVGGWSLGLFAALDLVLIRRWRRDPAFRARIRAGLSGSSSS